MKKQKHLHHKEKNPQLHLNMANDEAITAGINLNLPKNFFLKMGMCITIPAVIIILLLIVKDYIKKI